MADEFTRFIHRFRGRFTTMYPVVFRRCKMPNGSWGDTTIGNRKGKPVLSIRVSSDLSSDAQLFIAVHEAAHALQWRPEEAEMSREDEHDAEWGVAYARIWREVVG